MKLVVFGDSFPRGLIKDPIENSKEDQNRINFCQKLLELDNQFTSLENFSQRGSGNDSIAYEAYKRIVKKKYQQDSFFLICWSGITRYAYYDIAKDRYLNVNNSELFTKVITKQGYFALDTFIISLSNMLKHYKIPHAQINSFVSFGFSDLPREIYKECNYINPEYNNNTLYDIISEKYCKKSLTLWIEHSLRTKENNGLITDCRHPTEMGHQKIAETLNPYLKIMVDKQLKEFKIKQ